MDLVTYLHYIWSCPLQIVLAVTFLYIAMGPSVFAGVGVMLLMIPINAIIAGISRKLQVSLGSVTFASWLGRREGLTIVVLLLISVTLCDDVVREYACFITLGQTDETEGSSYQADERGVEWSESDQAVCVGGSLSG